MRKRKAAKAPARKPSKSVAGVTAKKVRVKKKVRLKKKKGAH